MIKSDIETIKTRAHEFCNAHGLNYNYDEKATFVTVGQAGFWITEVGSDGHPIDDGELDDVLNQCKQEHEQIEAIRWEDGLLYQALHNVGDDPVKSMIEDELGCVLSPEALDKVARVFWKYTHGDSRW
jgi:hypothetical protein